MTDKTAKIVALGIFSIGIIGSVYSLMNSPDILLSEDKKKLKIAITSYTLLGLGGGLSIGLLLPDTTWIKAQA